MPQTQLDPPAQNSKEGKLADRLRKASASHGTVSMKQTKQMIKKQVCKLLISVFKTLIRFNVNFKYDVLVVLRQRHRRDQDKMSL